MNKLIPILLTCLLSAPLRAEPLTGNDIYSPCRVQQSGSAEHGFCFGFVVGAVEGLKWGALVGVAWAASDEFEGDEYDLLSSFALGYCIPPAVTNGQIVDIVVRHLEDHPESRHESARTLIQSALQSNFPCK